MYKIALSIGSHNLGVAVGAANGIGVAPGATWVCCRGLNDQGSGTEANLISCGQFIITANPKPTVVSNSWGGGQGSTWFNDVINAWRAADIIPVFAAGSGGGTCGSIGSPGDQPGTVTAGATTNTDAIASFSSRGPSSSGQIKPDFVAPGQNIVSCGVGDNNYATMSGTSMSVPHVVGAIALYQSAYPGSSFDQVYAALAQSAFHPALTDADRECGLGEDEEDWPNNVYG